MRHRLRVRTSDDNLDLLLDTICNVFGGVIFIALLVAILANTSAHTVESEVAVIESIKIGQIESADADVVASNIADLELALNQLGATERLFDAQHVKAAAEKLIEIDRAVAEAHQRIEGQRSWIRQFDSTRLQHINTLDEQLAAVERDVANLEDDLIEIKDANRVEARLPITRHTRKTQVIFLLENGRLHWVPLGRAGTLFGGSFADHVRTRAFPQGTAVMANPTAGIDPHDNAAEMAAIFRQMDSDRHFFDLYVRADSVDEFAEVRRLLLGRDFRYNLSPLAQEQPLIFVTVSHWLTVQ